jgi:hypothetical protein
MLWREAHQCPVTESSSGERIPVTDCKAMRVSALVYSCVSRQEDLHVLACKRHAKITLSDAIHEAGQRRSNSDDECHDRTPVCSKLGRVAIDTIEVVHVWYRDHATTCNVVAEHKLIRCDVLLKYEGTYSAIMIAVIGPRKIVYPLKKARNFWAEARIFHYNASSVKLPVERHESLQHTGTQAQAPMIAAKI